MTAFIAKGAASAGFAFATAAAVLRRLVRLPEALAELIERHALRD